MCVSVCVRVCVRAFVRVFVRACVCACMRKSRRAPACLPACLTLCPSVCHEQMPAWMHVSLCHDSLLQLISAYNALHLCACLSAHLPVHLPVHQAITDDIERLISLTVDPATADYAVITGVQIHSGNQVNGSARSLRTAIKHLVYHVVLVPRGMCCMRAWRLPAGSHWFAFSLDLIW